VLKVRILDDRLRATTVEASSVVVYAEDGTTPVAVALEYQKGPPQLIFASGCDHPDFHAVLRALGVRDVVAVARRDAPRLDAPPGR